MSTPIQNIKIIGMKMPQSKISSHGGSAQSLPLQSTPVKCSGLPNSDSPMSPQSSPVKKHKNRKYVEYWCKYCDKYFKHKNNMKQHERTHTNERPFSCAICGMSFKKSSALLDHRRRHNGQNKETQKSHQCNDCGKIFNQKSSLVKHARTHSDAKEFHCMLCDKDFRHKSTFNRHKLMHSGIKKFVCDYCQKGFFDKGDFRKHIICHTQNSKFREIRHSKSERNHVGTVHSDKDKTSTAGKEMNVHFTKENDTDSKDDSDHCGSNTVNLSMRKVIYKTEPLSDSVEICQEKGFDYSNDVEIKEEIDSDSTIHAEICQENKAFENSSDVQIKEEIDSDSNIHADSSDVQIKEEIDSDSTIHAEICQEKKSFENSSDVQIKVEIDSDSTIHADSSDVQIKEEIDSDSTIHAEICQENKAFENSSDVQIKEEIESNSTTHADICQEKKAFEIRNYVQIKEEIVSDLTFHAVEVKIGMKTSNTGNENHCSDIYSDRETALLQGNTSQNAAEDSREKVKLLDFRSEETKDIGARLSEVHHLHAVEISKTEHLYSNSSKGVQVTHYENTAIMDNHQDEINIKGSKIIRNRFNEEHTGDKRKHKDSRANESLAHGIEASNEIDNGDRQYILMTEISTNQEYGQVSLSSDKYCDIPTFEVSSKNQKDTSNLVTNQGKQNKREKLDFIIMKMGIIRSVNKKERENKAVINDNSNKKICAKCKHEFTSRYDYKSHLKSHLIKSSYTCADCNRTFVKWRDYRRHGCNDEENQGKEPWRETKRFVIDHPCAYCSRIYKSEKQLEAHLFQRTSNTCEECLMAFCTFGQLENHFKKHFKCQDCSLGCISKLALERHRKLKHYESPFKCEICKTAFSRKYHLFRHNTLVHGVINLFSKCKYCCRLFVKHSNCLQHEINCSGTRKKWRIRDEAESQNVKVNVLQNESSEIESNTTLDDHDVCVEREVNEINAGIDLQISVNEDCKTEVIDTKFDNGNLVETQSKALHIETVNIGHSKPSQNVIKINKKQPLTTATGGKSEQSFIPILTRDTVKDRHLNPDIKTNIEESNVNKFPSDSKTVAISDDLFCNNHVHRKSSGKKCSVFTKSFNGTGSDGVVKDFCGSRISVNETLLTETLAETVWKENNSYHPGNRKDSTDVDTVSCDSEERMTEDDESGFEEEMIVLNHSGKIREEIFDLEKTGNKNEEHFWRTRVNGNRQKMTKQVFEKKIDQAFKPTIKAKTLDKKTKAVTNECENQIAKINKDGNNMDVIGWDSIESINYYQEMKKDNLKDRCESICGTDGQKRTNFDMIYTKKNNSCRASEFNSRKEIDNNISISVSSQNMAIQMKSSQRTRQQTKCTGIVKNHSEIQTNETSDDSDGSEDSSINSNSDGYEECTAEEIQAMLNNMKEKKTV